MKLINFAFLVTRFSKLLLNLIEERGSSPVSTLTERADQESMNDYLNFLHRYVKRKCDETTKFFVEPEFTPNVAVKTKWKKVWYPKPFPYHFLQVIVNPNPASPHNFKIYESFVHLGIFPTRMNFVPVQNMHDEESGGAVYTELPNRTDLLIGSDRKHIILTPLR